MCPNPHLHLPPLRQGSRWPIVVRAPPPRPCGRLQARRGRVWPIVVWVPVVFISSVGSSPACKHASLSVHMMDTATKVATELKKYEKYTSVPWLGAEWSPENLTVFYRCKICSPLLLDGSLTAPSRYKDPEKSTSFMHGNVVIRMEGGRAITKYCQLRVSTWNDFLFISASCFWGGPSELLDLLAQSLCAKRASPCRGLACTFWTKSYLVHESLPERGDL